MQFISLCSTEFLQDGKFFLFKFYNSLIMNELCFFIERRKKFIEKGRTVKHGCN